MASLYLSLGTNLGERKGNLLRALKLLQERLKIPPAAVSSFYESSPWGYDSPHHFLNACARFDLPEEPTRERALQILSVCKEIETEMGRIQRAPGEGYKDRIIDIDILLFGNLRMCTHALTIPHPLMDQRDFVLVPLREILP